MAETNKADKLSSQRDEEQREHLISKEKEGLVETTTEPDGVKQLESVKPGRFTSSLVFAILAIVLGSSFQFGFHIGATNIPGDIINQWVNTSYEQMFEVQFTNSTLGVTKGMMGGLFTIGGMIGGVMVGTVADTFGRRKPLLFNNFVAVLGAAMMVSAKYVNFFFLFFIGRFIIGINAGLNSGLAPMYLMELSPTNLRGSIGSLPQLFVTLSILVAQIIGIPYLLGTEQNWNWIFAFTLIPVVFQLCTLPLCPESPKYTLIVRGNKEQAENDLKKLRGDDDVHGELEQLMAEAEASRAQPKVGYGAMFRAPLLWPLVLAMFMMLSQQWSGINAAMFYSSDIFKEAGLVSDWVIAATISMGAINVLMTVVSVYMVERLGRRTLHLTGLVGTFLTTALIGFSMLMAQWGVGIFAYLSILFVLLFVIAFATGPGSIPWFYVSEVFPSNARGNANSIAVLTNWSANTFVVFLFPVIAEQIGAWAFFVFTVLLVFFILFAYKFLPETKNKTLEEVQAEMDRLRFGGT